MIIYYIYEELNHTLPITIPSETSMNIYLKKLIYLIKPPCPKCPYTLGYVHFIINPCPGCKENDYKTFEYIKNSDTNNITLKGGM